VPPHIVWTRSLYQGWTTLRLVRLRLESGDVVDSEVEDHGNAVAVLPFDPARRTALLVRILRAPAFLSTGRAELLECPRSGPSAELVSRGTRVALRVGARRVDLDDGLGHADAPATLGQRELRVPKLARWVS
jgi:hypothetical protein